MSQDDRCAVLEYTPRGYNGRKHISYISNGPAGRWAENSLLACAQ